MALPRFYYCMLFFIIISLASARNKDPDDYLTAPEIIRRHGYPAEAHTVETEDGYLLEMHRIPHGRRSNSTKTGAAVMLQHGIVASSDDWVLAGPNKSLSYILADSGYDVWIGNARGNGYSNGHVTLDPDSVDFWQFSFDQMGKYDLAAEIDHILQVTGQSQIFYIGHSMGTSMFFALMSTRPEYNEKVKLGIALAPVAYVSHMTSPLRYLAPFSHELEFILSLFGRGQFVPHPKLLHFITSFFCDKNKETDSICANVLFIIAGYDKAQMNATLLPLILQHTPADTSTRTILHYAQLCTSGRFAKFDYGEKNNLKIYNSSNPPSYNLSKVRTPVALFWSDNDLLVDMTDLHHLELELPNVVESYQIPFKGFNHLDYIFAMDAPKLVYSEVLKLLQSPKETNDIPDFIPNLIGPVGSHKRRKVL